MSGHRVCITVPTFRRDLLLAAALDGLARQRLSSQSIDVAVAVLDNDVRESARQTVERARATFPFPLHYRHVAARGLAHVRNAALDEARPADFLAMLDDDEVPEPQWLAELLRVQRDSRADAVVGPVPARLPADAPRWLRAFRDMELPLRRDGAALRDGWSGNCLVRMATVAAYGLRFDVALNFTGGEDQLFFRQLIARGGRIAYAARATAWEHTPAERRAVRSALARSFRRGNSLSHCDRIIGGTPLHTALRAAKGLGLIALAPVRALPLTAGSGGLMRCACDVARGAGMLAGVAGYAPRAYGGPA